MRRANQNKAAWKKKKKIKPCCQENSISVVYIKVQFDAFSSTTIMKRSLLCASIWINGKICTKITSCSHLLNQNRQTTEWTLQVWLFFFNAIHSLSLSFSPQCSRYCTTHMFSEPEEKYTAVFNYLVSLYLQYFAHWMSINPKKCNRCWSIKKRWQIQVWKRMKRCEILIHNI